VRERRFIDLHTHTLLSDGELLPSELVRRAVFRGCRGLAITDHADDANLDFVVQRTVMFARETAGAWGIPVLPGVELTHVPPRRIGLLIERARSLGARWIVVHGETVAEPVAPGTNRAAIEAGADLLAHPGLIRPEEAEEAARRGVFLEISTRKGHCLTNGWVARRALETGAPLLLNTDTHEPDDILEAESRSLVALGAGLDQAILEVLWTAAEEILERRG